MDLSMLHNASKAAEPDDLDMAPEDGETAMPVSSAALAAPMGGFAMEMDTDEDDDGFADAPRPPADESVAATPEASLEDMMRASATEIPAEPSEEEPVVEAVATAEEGEPKPDAEIDEDEFASSPGTASFAGPSMQILDRLNLGARHRKLVDLLKSSEDPEDAQLIADDYVNYLVDSGVADRVSRADQDKIEAEKMIQAVEQEGVYQTGGGALVSMLGSLLRFGRQPAGPRRDIQEAGKRRRLAEDEASGMAATMADRFSQQKLRRYRQQMLEIGAVSEQYRRAINDYNDAVLNAPGNEALKQAVEDRAAHNEWSVDHALADIAGGNADDDLKALLANAAATSLQHKEVADAFVAMHGMQDKLEDGFGKAMRYAESLQDSGLLDAERVQTNVMAAFDEIEKDLPDPIAEQEEKRKLAERMRALREALMAGVQALVERLANSLGMSR